MDNISYLQIFSEEIKGCRNNNGPVLIKTELNNTHFDQLKHFFNCIDEEKEPLINGEKAIKCIRLIEQSYKIMKI